MTCLQTVSLGAYVLGALDASERLETEDHLRDCAHCRDELIRLAPLPGLLGQVSLDDVLAPGDLVRPDLAAGSPPVPPTVRRRWTRVLPAAAAAVVIVVGIAVAGVVVVDDDSSDDPVAATWSTGADAAGIDATAALAERGWGTDIRLSMSDLPVAERCRLVVVASDGRVETAGWWTTTAYASEAEVPASTSIDVGDIDRMEVRTGDQVLAVLQPS